MNHSIAIAFLFCLLASELLCQSERSFAIPENFGFSSQRLALLDSKMHELVNNGQIAGVQTAIMRRNELIHFDTYGFADIESNKSLEENSIWRIYSMTKPIVSVGLMMLYEKGLFSLNDPVHLYIPELKEMLVHTVGNETKKAENPIRVIDILRHTSGFGYGWGPGNYVDSLYNAINRGAMKDNESFVENLSKLPLYYEPGQGWRYSVSTDVCGYLIEQFSGQPLDVYLSENILEPLGMIDTHFEVPAEKIDRFVTHYKPTKSGSIEAADHPSDSRYTKKVTMFSGGGGLVSTTADYLRFCQMLLNRGSMDGRRYISPATLDLMITDHTQDISHQGGPIALPGGGIGFGLGFSVVNNLAKTNMLGSVGTYGWGGAAGTYFRIDPKEELISIMMIQIRPYEHLQAREKFQNLVYQALVD